ncbi:unnamed protein product [Strongylus vulgaris]|uniref:Lipoprotein n=1 Tax=Strongylus vulgaris TaxID=40348 RepID=A0A3P7KZT7_STRVU|nr:unnamed protein product [Strongylus vulgaris]
MFRVLALFAIPTILFACSPTPFGQEVRVNFLVDGLMKIPMEFAYFIDQKDAQTKYPKFPTSATEAVANLRRLVKSAVTRGIKEEARRAGIEPLVTNIASQIIPTVYYNPMNCSKAGATADEPPKNPGFFCVVEGTELVKNVAYSKDNTAEIPLPYQRFTVSLSVSFLL